MISESKLFEKRKKPRSLDSRKFLSELQNQDLTTLPKIKVDYKYEKSFLMNLGRYNDDEDDDLNWAPIKSVSSLLQSNKPGAPSAAFASKVLNYFIQEFY